MSFHALGLGPDADEREVRRAYARLLKQTRPDDDPIAFQALHEAYQACLEQLRGGDGFDDHDQDDDQDYDRHEDDLAPSRTPPHRNTAVDEGPDGVGIEGIQLDTFVQELLARGAAGTTAELKAWLVQEPALYSIDLKSAITAPVLHAVIDHEPPLRPQVLEVVAEFFGADQLGRHDWWLLEAIEDAKARSRTLDQFSSGRLPRANPQEEVRLFEALMDKHVARRHWRWTSLALMLVPGVPTRMHHRIEELDNLSQGATTELIHPKLRRIAATLANRNRVGWPRLALTWSRTGVFGLPLLAAFSALDNKWSADSLLALAVLALVSTGWQLLVAGYATAKRRLEQRGLGHLWREIWAGLLLLGALAASLLSQPTSGIFLAIAGTLAALTTARFPAGFAIMLYMGSALVLAGPFNPPEWPVSPFVLALCYLGLLALLVDRLQARLTGRSVEQLTDESRWFMIAGAVSVTMLLVVIAILH